MPIVCRIGRVDCLAKGSQLAKVEQVKRRQMSCFPAEPHRDLDRVLFSEEQIAARIADVGR